MSTSTKRTPLIILTSAYPFGGEVTFLQKEIKILCEYFGPIVLVPRIISEPQCQLPPQVTVDTSFSKFMNCQPGKSKKIINLMFTKSLLNEVVSNLSKIANPVNFRRMLQATYEALRAQEWVESKIKESDFSRSCLFYTYWLGKYTLGIGNAINKYPKVKLISRAHGVDLYPRDINNTYMPCQGQAIKNANVVFAVSRDGSEFLKSKYPWANNLEIARLGVNGPVKPSDKSSDGVFRIVSCSGLRPVKRIDLLANGLIYAAKSRPTQQFQWNHFGDGETRPLVEKVIEQFPDNLNVRLWGQLSNENVLEFYQRNPIDIFINVSSSEGLPVSIMEAFSFGIPVIATNVGGMPEIINADNGWLLPENPSSEEIAESLLKCIDDHRGLLSKRKAARKMWFDKYNADVNFEQFAQSLKSLIS